MYAHLGIISHLSDFSEVTSREVTVSFLSIKHLIEKVVYHLVQVIATPTSPAVQGVADWCTTVQYLLLEARLR